MHIPLDEALVLLNNWKNKGTRLRVHASGAGIRQDMPQGTIRGLKGTIVEIGDDEAKLEVDLKDADFNGDWSPPAYLICEFRDGGRYSFYALRDGVTGMDSKSK
jgi:hypothetical protein